MKKSQNRWDEAHVKLRQLFEQRAGMSQQEFAEKYDLGTQGMVWQYLSGHRPLNLEAAAKFAKGLNCTIADFAPGMAKLMRSEILPVLGKAASIAMVALVLAFSAPDSKAADSHGLCEKAMSALCIMLNGLSRLIERILFVRLFRAFAA